MSMQMANPVLLKEAQKLSVEKVGGVPDLFWVGGGRM